MKRTFIHLTSAWYGEAVLKHRDDIIDDVYISIEGEDVTGETIRHEAVFSYYGSTGLDSPRFQIFSDSWDMLSEMEDVFGMMKVNGGRPLPPKPLMASLKSLGFLDATLTEPR